MTCWQDPADDVRMRNWMYDKYVEASSVGVGQYIADFDSTHRKERVSQAPLDSPDYRCLFLVL